MSCYGSAPTTVNICSINSGGEVRSSTTIYFDRDLESSVFFRDVLEIRQW